MINYRYILFSYKSTPQHLDLLHYLLGYYSFRLSSQWMVHILAAWASYSLLVPFTILYAFLRLHKFDFKNTVKKINLIWILVIYVPCIINYFCSKFRWLIWCILQQIYYINLRIYYINLMYLDKKPKYINWNRNWFMTHSVLNNNKARSIIHL